MIKNLMLFMMLSALVPAAHAWCYPNMHQSENYNFEFNCNVDRIKDFTKRKTYDLSCSKGLVFYYYCIKN